QLREQRDLVVVEVAPDDPPARAEVPHLAQRQRKLLAGGGEWSRSAVVITASHSPGMVGALVRATRAGSALAGMAASRSRSAAGTRSCRLAARMEAPKTCSHWQAAFSARRWPALAGTPGPGAWATLAPWRAIGWAKALSSAKSARL